jgi:hypothetical protein
VLLLNEQMLVVKVVKKFLHNYKPLSIVMIVQGLMNYYNDYVKVFVKLPMVVKELLMNLIEFSDLNNVHVLLSMLLNKLENQVDRSNK